MSWTLDLVYDLFTSEIIVTPFTLDKYGDEVLGSGETIAARVVGDTRRVINSKGQEVVVTRRVITSGHHDIRVDTDLITLPDWSQPNEPLHPVSVKTVEDPDTGEPMFQVVRL